MISLEEKYINHLDNLYYFFSALKVTKHPYFNTIFLEYRTSKSDLYQLQR